MRILTLITSLALASVAVGDPFDLVAVRNPETLDTKVIQDWSASPRDPSIRTKLVEITVCEWWPGQTVRLPVTFIAPAKAVCTNMVVLNMGLALRPALPKPDELALLRENGVGFVMIGMGTIDAMAPAGTLHLGMKRQLLKTRDPRYTPAWIWGMSEMRGLTAALVEKEVFQPGKVLASGGSKRGVATAAAGIHDDRFTAIMPVVAPPLGNPGGPVVIGTEAPRHLRADQEFFTQLIAGKLGLDLTAKAALEARHDRRVAERISRPEAVAAGWSADEIADLTPRAWNVSRVTDHLPALRQRGLEIFYCVGANDSVSPALMELGRRHPDFPVYIVPGGQHGGPADAGFTRRVPLLDDVRENFTSFARHHFFGTRTLPASPVLTHHWDDRQNTLSVAATFAAKTNPSVNTLWWSVDRSEPFTLFFEYDVWESQSLKRDRTGAWKATIKLHRAPRRLDILTVHRDEENGLPFTVSSPYLRVLGE